MSDQLTTSMQGGADEHSAASTSCGTAVIRDHTDVVLPEADSSQGPSVVPRPSMDPIGLDLTEYTRSWCRYLESTSVFPVMYEGTTYIVPIPKTGGNVAFLTKHSYTPDEPTKAVCQALFHMKSKVHLMGRLNKMYRGSVKLMEDSGVAQKYDDGLDGQTSWQRVTSDICLSGLAQLVEKDKLLHWCSPNGVSTTSQ
ncbi:hypothetical protein TREMEDRAFT_62207 [Tremella mesenterica DSM 1558]|uniref:uncharacterized protein n=1 Tax=Tremella mesenterica (strain ATCC 24925 / CBS 8224 / DSM 1558 / NBRC 9311 / NRRL Y-6157 / RJB 2259-6 / UBC 559-6) TaxID=578456 RepID=UPI0003F48CB3|nr:uncharacterized protein TREMEDRAFT_62207 [Tremella mesenterica DSM 1558]EIW69343.1 hypothetical protein TREMEDRAFT_62207 [Tremella mesenterica DSM 1558]